MRQEDASWDDSGTVERGQCGPCDAVTSWGHVGRWGKVSVEMRGATSVEGDMRWGCVSQKEGNDAAVSRTVVVARYICLYMYRMLLSLRVYRGGVDKEDGPGTVSGAVLP